MTKLSNKVFCIGLSRTGTTSLHHFFEKSNLKSLHYSTSLFAHPEIVNDTLSFQPALKKNFIRSWIFKKEWQLSEKKKLKDIFSEFQVFSDNPIPVIFPYLDQKFPESKFIYTYRNEEKWLKSMEWMLNKGRIIWNWRDIDDELLYYVYGTHRFNRKKLLDSFRNHHEKVTCYFKGREKDILSINIDEEGVPLQKICAFLGLPSPIHIKTVSMNKSREVGKLNTALYHFKRVTFLSEAILELKRFRSYFYL